MRTVLTVLFTIVYLIYGIPISIKAKHMKKKGDPGAEAYIYKMANKWATHMMNISGARITAENCDDLIDGPTVIVANHQGNYDVMLLLSMIHKPFTIVAKKDLAKIPGIATWMKLLDCVFIDRSDMRQALRTMHTVGDMVASGKSVLIFPEGTRSRCSEMGEFKSGAFKMTFKNGTPVTPIGVDGTYNLFEANHNRIKPADVRIKVFPAIPTADMDRAQQKVLGDEIKESLMEWIHTPAAASH